jgi:tight adherence protein C
MTFVLVLGIVLFIGGAYLLIDLITLPARQRRASIGRATFYAGAGELAAGGPSPFRDRAVSPAVQKLADAVVRVTPRAAVDSIGQRLLTGGLAHRFSPTVFLALKGAMGIAGFALGVLAGGSSGGAFRAVFLGAAFGAAFFILPDRILAGRIRSRQESIESNLPDALDLIAISVEAGLSLDGAFGEIVDHMQGPLADELAQTLAEIRVGENRSDALRRLAERVDLPAMTTLTRAIIQSDQLGVSLGRILRIQARDTRLQRQQAAEERANKMPVKMLFPTLIFIFPALFIIVLGPALITLFDVL